MGTNWSDRNSSYVHHVERPQFKLCTSRGVLDNGNTAITLQNRATQQPRYRIGSDPSGLTRIELITADHGTDSDFDRCELDRIRWGVRRSWHWLGFDHGEQTPGGPGT